MGEGDPNYTRNEWRGRKTTLETSGEDAKLHSQQVIYSKRVNKIQTTLETSEEDPNYTRNE